MGSYEFLFASRAMCLKSLDATTFIVQCPNYSIVTLTHTHSTTSAASVLVIQVLLLPLAEAGSHGKGHETAGR